MLKLTSLALMLCGVVVAGSGCGVQADNSGTTGTAADASVDNSTQATIPYRNPSEPWWDQEPHCGLGGDDEGYEVIGLPAGSPGVYDSLTNLVEDTIPGPPWDDYRPALADYLKEHEPESTMKSAGPHEAALVTFGPGPGGAHLQAYTWDDDLWSISSFGFPIPCTIFDIERGDPVRDQYLSMTIVRSPLGSSVLDVRLPREFTETAYAIDVYSAASPQAGYDHVARWVATSEQDTELTWIASDKETDPPTIRIADDASVEVPGDVPHGRYVACVETEALPDTVCGEFDLESD